MKRGIIVLMIQIAIASLPLSNKI